MTKWKVKQVGKYTATTLQDVSKCFASLCNFKAPYYKTQDIQSLVSYYHGSGLFTLDIADTSLFIPYRLPLIAEAFRPEVVDSKDSPLFEYLNGYPDTVFFVFDMATRSKNDSLFIVQWYNKELNNLKTWLSKSDDNNISLLFRSHGSKKLIVSNVSAFCRKQTADWE